MTDLEIKSLCAKAIGIVGLSEDYLGNLFWVRDRSESHAARKFYNPLKNDAQVMELVKKFKLNIGQLSDGSSDFHRAICECVAKMQSERK